MYDYKAQVIKVVDGDTLHLDVDLGMDVHTRMTVRLNGLDAPEMSTPDGRAARVHLAELLSTVGGPILGLEYRTVRVLTVKDRREKYGRYLAVIYLWDAPVGEPSINQRMIDDGHAVAYHGGKRT